MAWLGESTTFGPALEKNTPRNYHEFTNAHVDRLYLATSRKFDNFNTKERFRASPVMTLDINHPRRRGTSTDPSKNATTSYRPDETDSMTHPYLVSLGMRKAVVRAEVPQNSKPSGVPASPSYSTGLCPAWRTLYISKCRTAIWQNQSSATTIAARTSQHCASLGRMHYRDR